MADSYREDDDTRDLGDEDRVRQLDPDAAPEVIGVYERPERARPGLNIAAVVGIILLLVLAYFVLTALL